MLHGGQKSLLHRVFGFGTKTENAERRREEARTMSFKERAERIHPSRARVGNELSISWHEWSNRVMAHVLRMHSYAEKFDRRLGVPSVSADASPCARWLMMWGWAGSIPSRITREPYHAPWGWIPT
jgi:hypothetical protein